MLPAPQGYSDYRDRPFPHFGYLIRWNEASGPFCDVSKSLTEVTPVSPIDGEAYALCELTKRMLEFIQLIHELGFEYQGRAKVYTDSDLLWKMCNDRSIGSAATRYFIQRLSSLFEMQLRRQRLKSAASLVSRIPPTTSLVAIVQLSKFAMQVLTFSVLVYSKSTYSIPRREC
jgi:hypothetical protein